MNQRSIEGRIKNLSPHSDAARSAASIGRIPTIRAVLYNLWETNNRIHRTWNEFCYQSLSTEVLYHQKPYYQISVRH